MADKDKKKTNVGEGLGYDCKFSMLRIDHGGQCFIMFDFQANLLDSTMNSCTCINSASF